MVVVVVVQVELIPDPSLYRQTRSQAALYEPTERYHPPATSFSSSINHQNAQFESQSLEEQARKYEQALAEIQEQLKVQRLSRTTRPYTPYGPPSPHSPWEQSMPNYPSSAPRTNPVYSSHFRPPPPPPSHPSHLGEPSLICLGQFIYRYISIWTS